MGLPSYDETAPAGIDLGATGELAVEAGECLDVLVDRDFMSTRLSAVLNLKFL